MVTLTKRASPKSIEEQSERRLEFIKNLKTGKPTESIAGSYASSINKKMPLKDRSSLINQFPNVQILPSPYKAKRLSSTEINKIIARMTEA
jgi:hypothetical protein